MTFWKAFLKFIGVRTPCCGARFEEREKGWDRKYCVECGRRYKFDL